MKPLWRWWLFCLCLSLDRRFRWAWAERVWAWCVLPTWLASEEELAEMAEMAAHPEVSPW